MTHAASGEITITLGRDLGRQSKIFTKLVKFSLKNLVGLLKIGEPLLLLRAYVLFQVAPGLARKLLLSCIPNRLPGDRPGTEGSARLGTEWERGGGTSRSAEREKKGKFERYVPALVAVAVSH